MNEAEFIALKAMKESKTDRTHGVLEEIHNERLSQTQKFGIQAHPDLSIGNANLTRSQIRKYAEAELKKARERCETSRILDKNGPSWISILDEEFLEAMVEAACGNLDALRAELVQVAAVSVAWIEDIDRRKK